MKFPHVSLRTWLVIGTAAAFLVGVVLVALAYQGWTFGLGTHDKPTLVTVALTADALFFGFVAAVLALAAYWSASGTARLSIEIRFNYSDVNKPVFRVDDAREFDKWVPIEPFKQTHASVVLRNGTRYAARNPWVCIALRGISLSAAPAGWKATNTANMVGITELMWQGDVAHGLMPLPLPNFVLSDSCLVPPLEPVMEVTIVADGLKPLIERLPVAGLDDAAYEQYMTERNERIRNERTELAYQHLRVENRRAHGFWHRLRRAALHLRRVGRRQHDHP